MGVASSYFVLEDKENPKPATYTERVEKRKEYSLKQKRTKKSPRKPKKTKVSKNKKK